MSDSDGRYRQAFSGSPVRRSRKAQVEDARLSDTFAVSRA